MALTNRYYGGTSLGAGRTIQDFSMCDLAGSFVYTAKLRPKGLLAVVFFAPDGQVSSTVVKTVQQWADEIGLDKWTALGVAGPDRDTLKSFAEAQGISKVTIVVDHELHQTRSWGISHLPSVFIIDGKSGRILKKVIGDDASELNSAKELLSTEVAKIKAAEEAAKKAEEEKKAAEAAAKAADAAKADTAKKPETAKA